MSTVQLSIVIPTKNEANYIDRTLAQFEEWLEPYGLEIIVSDANSTDGTAEIVRRYEARYGPQHVKLVQARGKQNIAIGRNLGAAAASGDILFHMDADVYIPQKQRFFETVLQTFSRPEVVAATVPLRVYPDETRLSDRLYHVFMNMVIRLSFVAGVYLAKGECQLVRRRVFEKIGGYNEKIVAGEDCNLFYRLSKEGHISYLWHLRVHHSPRRFRQYGYWGISWIYLREGLSLLFRGRSYAEEWEPVR
ncbi:MAG: glycosyltransferase [Saprospiraceae bacterium]|nr:glycosyltransferase [Saprospiraceae bacterium]